MIPIEGRVPLDQESGVTSRDSVVSVRSIGGLGSIVTYVPGVL
jgi:hypothetical protein